MNLNLKKHFIINFDKTHPAWEDKKGSKSVHIHAAASEKCHLATVLAVITTGEFPWSLNWHSKCVIYKTAVIKTYYSTSR